MGTSEKTPGMEELLEFPCDYTFKAFGSNDDPFREAVHGAVSSIVPVSLDAMKDRPSGKGTYTCVSVLVRLQNFEQVKAIYAALRLVEGLKYLL